MMGCYSITNGDLSHCHLMSLSMCQIVKDSDTGGISCVEFCNANSSAVHVLKSFLSWSPHWCVVVLEADKFF